MQCFREYRATKGHFKNDRAKKWEESNKELRNGLRRDWNVRNPKMAMLSSCRGIAKKRGLPFDLSTDDFEIPDICPVLGMPLVRSNGARTDASPSLDRIIPALGYVRGNVIVVSWRANLLKRDASVEEMQKLAAFYTAITRD